MNLKEIEKQIEIRKGKVLNFVLDTCLKVTKPLHPKHVVRFYDFILIVVLI